MFLEATIDSRDLPREFSLCDLGADCRPCEDGVPACTEVSIEMEALRVDIDFNSDADGTGC